MMMINKMIIMIVKRILIRRDNDDEVILNEQADALC